MLKEQTLRYAVKRNEEALSHIDIAEILEQNQSPENADETNYFQLNNEEPHRFETLTASNRNNELRIGKRKDSAIAEEIDLINSPKKAKLSIFSSPMSVQDGEMVAAIHQQRIEKAEEMASPSSASTSIFSGVAETIKSFLGKITNSAVKENPKVEDESSHGRTMGTQVAVDSLIMLASVDKGDDNDYHVSSPLPTKRVDYPVFDLSKADDDYDMLIRSPEEDANRYKISGKGRLRKSSSSRLSIDDDWQ